MVRSKLLPFVVAAAVAMIVIANFSILKLLARHGEAGIGLFYSVWPLLLTSTTAIVLVMSTLYHALQGVLKELEEREESARSAGYQDPLTKLGNRSLLADRLQQSNNDLRRAGRPFALMMLDLDRFKDVNDLLGHAIGDELLVQLASRLGEAVRETDTLIRFGGDEFMVLQTDVASTEDVVRLSSRVSESLQRPFLIESHELKIGASMGAVIAERAVADASEYIRQADIALYEAKRRGRNRVEFYSSDLDSKLRRRALLEGELAQAISRESIDVYFQPQIGTDGRVIAAEALLRWNSRKFGAVSATEIVAIAEEAGLIRALGKLVFRKACKAARRWPDLTMAVNFSRSQLVSRSLPEKLQQICKEERVSCKQIELELTESLFLEQDEGWEALIALLRQHGFKIALDDFGAGYSSLRYLRRFRVDKVKLDKGFSDGSEVSQNIAIIRAAVMLAHTLGLSVIAEGIETADQEQVAIQGGCDGFQGYRYAPPMSAVDFSAYLESRSVSAA